MNASNPADDGLLQLTWRYRALQQWFTERHLARLEGQRVCVYGGGQSGQLATAALQSLGVQVVAVVDGSPTLAGTCCAGLPVQPSSQLASVAGSADILLIAASSPASTAAIERRLADAGLALPVLKLTEDAAEASPVTLAEVTTIPAGETRRERQPRPLDFAWMAATWMRLPVRPTFVVAAAVGADAATLGLDAQTYPLWTLGGVGRRRGGRRSQGTGPRVRVSLRAGTRLAPHAFFELALEASTGSFAGSRVRLETHLRRLLDRRDDLWIRPPRSARGPRRGTLAVLGHRAPLRVVRAGEVRRVLVVKLDHIGDVVLSFPAIRRIHAALPAARITVLAGSWARDLIERTLVADGCVERVLVFDAFSEVSGHGTLAWDARSREALCRMLAPYDFDVAVDLRRVDDARVILDAIPARVKVAFGHDDVRRRLALPGFVNTPQKDHSLHIVDQLELLVDAFLARIDRGEAALLPPAPRRRPGHRVPGAPRARWTIGVAPGSGDDLRRWPESSFGDLVRELVEGLDAAVVLYGAPRERELAERIAQAGGRPDRVMVAAGRFDLSGFLDHVTHCHAFVGSTTGPTHLAAGLGVPTINVFSGQVSPFEWAPIGAAAFVLWTKPRCAPCYLPAGRCPFDRVCLTSITAHHVGEHLRRVLVAAYGAPLARVPRTAP